MDDEGDNENENENEFLISQYSYHKVSLIVDDEGDNENEYLLVY